MLLTYLKFRLINMALPGKQAHLIRKLAYRMHGVVTYFRMAQVLFFPIFR